MNRRNLSDEYNYEIYSPLTFNQGDHICSFYDNEEDKIDLMAQYLKDGLINNEKVLCITNDTFKNRILDKISAKIGDIRDYLTKGNLEVLSSCEVFTRNGSYSPDDLITYTKQAQATCLDAGYSGLRGAGDMAWVLENSENMDSLLECEARLNAEVFGAHSKCTSLCQYDMRLFPPKILNAILKSHPTCHLGKEVYPNQFYISPEARLSADIYSSILDYKIHQIKERKKREQTVAYLFKQTEELKEFSHILVHDLKGPINTASILTSMLEEEFSKDTLQRAIATLKKASERLEGIEDINKVAYPTSIISTLDLNKFLRELINGYQEELNEIGGSLILHETDTISIKAKRPHLLQIFNNLISNAIKYRNKNKKLCINIYTHLMDPDKAKVIIEDNGIGFSDSMKEKIFQPFFRAANALNIDGSGMGLTICKKIIQKYDGSITAHSQDGKGTTFELTFPLTLPY